MEMLNLQIVSFNVKSEMILRKPQIQAGRDLCLRTQLKMYAELNDDFVSAITQEPKQKKERKHFHLYRPCSLTGLGLVL